MNSRAQRRWLTINWGKGGNFRFRKTKEGYKHNHGNK